MTKKRIKFVNPLTRQLAEEMLGDIATLTLELNSQKVEMDRQLSAIREKYEKPISSLNEQIGDKVAILDAWASANPDEFPKNRKSIEFVHGVVGYRTGTPKLKTLLRKTWKSILENLAMLGETRFLRVTTEINKENILDQYAQKNLSAEYLRKLGMEVAQDETFYVEPKLEGLETRSQKAAA